MKLDLLYEIDVPKPWAGAPPVRPARGRAARVPGGARADQARRQARASTRTWHVEHHFREGRSHSPAPEVIIGALSPVHREHPPRLRRHADAARVHAADARRREGGDRRHPLERPRRVGHRPLDADGADRVRRRPRDESRDQWEEAIQRRRADVGGRVLRVPRQVPRLPAAHGHAQAGAGPAPAVLDGGDARRQRRGRRASSGSGCCRSRSCSRSSSMAQQIAQYREAAANPDADHPGHHEQGGRLHARALRRHDGAVRGERHLGLGVVVVQEPRRVHARVGVPALHRGGAGQDLPAAQDASSRATSTRRSSTTPT